MAFTVKNQLDELMTFYNYKESNEHQFFEVQVFLQEVLVIQPMSYIKRNVYDLKIKAIEVLH